MPWIAERDGEPIAPHEADSGDALTCPDCGADFHVVASHRRGDGIFVARHFSHPSGGSGGGGGDCPGESDTHRRFKSVVISKLRHRFGRFLEEIDDEAGVGDRVADVAATFTTDLGDLGGLLPVRGALGDQLAVEVQYRHEGKDTDAVTRDYLNRGYSVLWLTEGQFSDRDVALLEGEGQTWVPVYPNVLGVEAADPTEPTPVCWETHRRHLLDEPGAATTVSAAFPPRWFDTALARHLADLDDGPQYERWLTLFPDLAERYEREVRRLHEYPGLEAQALTRTLYPLCRAGAPIRPQDGTIPAENRVCGNCRWHENDEFQDDEEAIICWRNQPEGTSNRPRKLTLVDEFAGECSHFAYRPWFDEQAAEEHGVPSRLQGPHHIDALRPETAADPREAWKAVLKAAHYRVWQGEEWCNFVPSYGRSEAMLRELGYTPPENSLA